MTTTLSRYGTRQPQLSSDSCDSGAVIRLKAPRERTMPTKTPPISAVIMTLTTDFIGGAASGGLV